jgi:hypothetical protein
MRPEPHQCWCGDPKLPPYDLCDRHHYAEQTWAETGVNNWDKTDEEL